MTRGSESKNATRLGHLRMLARYKRWADDLTFQTVVSLPESEILRQRSTRWSSIVHTLNHVYVVDDIFKAHLEGREHGYVQRNSERTPAAGHLARAVQQMDDWFVDFADSLTEDDIDELIEFEFVGGGQGAMTKEQILLHLVNHATYHRGMISNMLREIPAEPLTNDLTVFLRDHYRPGVDASSDQLVDE